MLTPLVRPDGLVPTPPEGLGARVLRAIVQLVSRPAPRIPAQPQPAVVPQDGGDALTNRNLVGGMTGTFERPETGIMLLPRPARPAEPANGAVVLHRRAG